MARDFNGNTANFLNVGDAAAIDITGTDITVACWVYFDSVAAAAGLVTKWGNTAATRQYGLELAGTAVIDFVVSSGAGSQTCLGATAVTANRWHHFCGVQNSTDIFAYLNGVQDGTNTNQLSLPNTTALLQFGKYEVNGFPLDGRLAEIGIWATPLTAGEVATLGSGVSPLTVQPSLLRGYWPLCGIGSPEPDAKSGNPATINGTVPAATHPGGAFQCEQPSGQQTHRLGRAGW